MLEGLVALGTVRRPLIVDESSGRLASAVRDAGGEPAIWLRCLTAGLGEQPLPWPPDGSFDAALIRLPKAKDVLEFALHAAAARLGPGAPLAIFGANAEGIRSASRHLAVVADNIETLAARHHARVVIGRRKPVIDGHKARLEDWQRLREVEIAGVRRDWVSYPGSFAKGGIDDGTAFLLRHLETVPDGARVMDFAAGTGVIAAAISIRSPRAAVDMIERDALAIEAARRNVPAARALLGDSLAAAGETHYDLIVSNPPIHDGIAESRRVLDRLIAEAPRYLAPGGQLLLVVQRRMPIVAALSAVFGHAHVLADDGRFTVAMGELTPPSR
jgi:16S rRNA (guanine1207-N2)-methyltransferase